VGDGIRTHDIRNHNPTLYHLSYTHQMGRDFTASLSQHRALPGPVYPPGLILGYDGFAGPAMLRTLLALCCASCSLAFAATFPCGELASTSVGALLDALTSNPDAVGGEAEKKRCIVLQSMNATLVLFACPDSSSHWMKSGDRKLVERWLADFPSTVLAGSANSPLAVAPFVDYFRSGVFALGPEASESEVAGRIQQELQSRVTRPAHILPKRVCGAAADTVIRGFGEVIKFGTGAVVFAVERQFTVLLGICPEETVTMLSRDPDLMQRWADLLQPALFDVLPEYKATAERERTALIRYLRALKLRPDLMGTVDSLVRAAQQATVRVID
jgi:hypothetical protein